MSNLIQDDATNWTLLGSGAPTYDEGVISFDASSNTARAINTTSGPIEVGVEYDVSVEVLSVSDGAVRLLCGAVALPNMSDPGKYGPVRVTSAGSNAPVVLVTTGTTARVRDVVVEKAE